jgi:hypothetical protein
MPDGAAAAAAAAHAARCDACRAEWNAARAVESLLAETDAPAAARAGFAERAMARIGAERRREPRAAAPRPAPVPDLPWWVRAAAEPTTALACALAALVVGIAGPLAATAPSAASAAAALLAAAVAAAGAILGATGLAGALAASLERPLAAVALAAGLAPALLIASRALFRWAEGLASAARARARRLAA